MRQVCNGVNGTNRGSNEGKRRESRILQKLDEDCMVGGGTYSTVILLAPRSLKRSVPSLSICRQRIWPRYPGPSELACHRVPVEPHNLISIHPIYSNNILHRYTHKYVRRHGSSAGSILYSHNCHRAVNRIETH